MNVNKIIKGMVFGLAVTAVGLCVPHTAEACTGITLKSQDGATVLARGTIEWGGSYLNSRYVVVPRGYVQQSYVPGGQKNGLKFTAAYGYVGIAVELEDFVADGLNEAGLAAGLFYFPHYGSYEAYGEGNVRVHWVRFATCTWMLSRFKTVDEVKEALGKVHVVGPNSPLAYCGRLDEVVLEIVGGIPHFYENELGTNSGFEWQMTNLNNYVNLYAGGGRGQTVWQGETCSFWRGQRLFRDSRRRDASVPFCACGFL